MLCVVLLVVRVLLPFFYIQGIGVTRKVSKSITIIVLLRLPLNVDFKDQKLYICYKAYVGLRETFIDIHFQNSKGNTRRQRIQNSSKKTQFFKSKSQAKSMTDKSLFGTKVFQYYSI
jgi:hypothetical protein